MRFVFLIFLFAILFAFIFVCSIPLILIIKSIKNDPQHKPNYPNRAFSNDEILQWNKENPDDPCPLN